MVDASTITDDAAESWNRWLRSARQGRSLREWGLVVEDLTVAIKFLSKAHPVPTRGGKWGSRRKGQVPDVLGMVSYLKGALKCLSDFEPAPSGYRSLIYGPAPLMYERPSGASGADEACPKLGVLFAGSCPTSWFLEGRGT